jgi:hypothetical protein
MEARPGDCYAADSVHTLVSLSSSYEVRYVIILLLWFSRTVIGDVVCRYAACVVDRHLCQSMRVIADGSACIHLVLVNFLPFF